MNYDEQEAYNAWVSYTNLDYLLDNWDTECNIIRRWCAVLGVTDYTVEKPALENVCIIVRFKNPVMLEEYEYDSDDFIDMDYEDDCDGFDQDDMDEYEDSEQDDVDETDE
jgi:hypothetical protein